MRITKNQLRRIIKEEKQKLITENRVRKVVRKALLNEGMHPGMHPLDAEVAELDHNYGKSDVYSYLYSALSKLAMAGDEDAMDAREEFEMAENYGHDDPDDLLDILYQFGLKDKVHANM